MMINNFLESAMRFFPQKARVWLSSPVWAMGLSIACCCPAKLVADMPSFLNVKMDAAGNKVAIWEAVVQGENRIIFSASLSVYDNSWSKPVAISSPGSQSMRPYLAVNESGHAVVLWQMRNPESQTTSLYAAMLPAGGNWTEPHLLSAPNECVSHTYNVEINAAGDIVVLWDSYVGDTNEYVINSASGSFSTGTWCKPLQLTGN